MNALQSGSAGHLNCWRASGRGGFWFEDAFRYKLLAFALAEFHYFSGVR